VALVVRGVHVAPVRVGCHACDRSSMLTRREHGTQNSQPGPCMRLMRDQSSTGPKKLASRLARLLPARRVRWYLDCGGHPPLLPL